MDFFFGAIAFFGVSDLLTGFAVDLDAAFAMDEMIRTTKLAQAEATKKELPDNLWRGYEKPISDVQQERFYVWRAGEKVRLCSRRGNKKGKQSSIASLRKKELGVT